MFIETVLASSYTVTSSPVATSIFASKMEIWDFILLAISLVVLFAWVFSIAYILWWGVLLILSGWKDEKIKPAINSIRFALIWLVVIVLSIFIFPRLAWMLWMDVTKYASPDKIFKEIKLLWDKFFWWWTWLDSTINYETNSLESLPADFSDL